jgi:hypothetical protein
MDIMVLFTSCDDIIKFPLLSTLQVTALSCCAVGNEKYGQVKLADIRLAHVPYAQGCISTYTKFYLLDNILRLEL